MIKSSALFALLIILSNPLFAQNSESPNEQVSKAVDDVLKKISTQVSSEYSYRRQPGYYIPALSVGFRFGAENLFFGSGVPLFGVNFDIRFMRFTQGFALLRLLIEAPMGKPYLGNNPSEDLSLLSSSYIISGGFGGGFSFLDNRLGRNGIGHVATVNFLVTVGSRFGTPGRPFEMLSTYGGLEVGFRYQYYFFRYASVLIGLDIGFRFGTTSSITYGGVFGFAF